MTPDRLPQHGEPRSLGPLDRLRRIHAWQGEIPLQSRYTVGVAAQPFFDALRTEDRLLASRCPTCGTQALPPTLACPQCFELMTDHIPVEGPGRVEAVTTVHLDLFDQPLPTPQRVVQVAYEGVVGGLIHFALDENLQIGDRVQLVLRPAAERRGTIEDIAGFRRA